jgi:small subunit ribosomal protein S18
MEEQTQEQTEQQQSRNIESMSFLDVDSLSRFTTETGKILPRRITGLTAKQQRDMTAKIKRARNLLLMK